MAGLAAAIRLSHAGYKVNIFEKNAYPGGKLSELWIDKYRFDKGPSLFTLPELVDELTQLTGYSVKFNYHKLDTITHYFYEDGTELHAYADKIKFANELGDKLNEDKKSVLKHLEKSRFYYEITSDLFLHQSLHKFRSFLNFKTFRGILNSPRLGLFKSMHAANAAAFKNEKTVQLFNRYATYNGSDPYKAPALMNIIHHLEFGIGAYLPEKGMHQITEHLVGMAKYVGVTFNMNSPVEKVVVEKGRVKGVMAKGVFYASDSVVSDVDIHFLYKHLLPAEFKPQKLLKQEKSSSAFVFYWGIKKEFKELGLHNILFSQNNKQEFDRLFHSDEPYNDPTIYINITSKLCKTDAPEGCENWFVMVNVPHNKKGSAITYENELRANVISKINRILKTDIESFIEVETKLDPLDIELQTSSFGGSLYGNSSNNKFSAFLRHANYSSKIKGMYLVGGSVHPGGGIPLCLLSAKIACSIVEERSKA